VESAAFGRNRRLRRKRDFDAVLRQPSVRLSRGPLWLAARPNALAEARLGLIVGKRVLRRAVDRNRAKRVIRESFRQATSLPDMDIVVRVVQPDARVTVAHADRLFAALSRLLARRAERARGG